MSGETRPVESSIEGLLKFPSKEVEPKYRRFSWMIADRFEEDLRLLFFYDSYDFQLHFLREELLVEDLLPRLSKLHRRAVEDLSLTGSGFSEVFGELHCQASIHEDVAVLCFQEEEQDMGLIASVDYSGGFLSVP